MWDRPGISEGMACCGCEMRMVGIGGTAEMELGWNWIRNAIKMCGWNGDSLRDL